MMIPTSDEIRFRARCLNRGLFNPPTLRRRHYDGALVGMRQSGTHWVRYMLGLALAEIHDLPRPTRIRGRSIIGKSMYPQIPQIVSFHSAPHYLLRSRTLFRFLRFPRYVILMRDIRDGLVANYEKWRTKYNVDFSTFLRADMGDKRYRDDIWLKIEYLNGWGAVAESHPDQVAIFKYEDLVREPRENFARICDYFRIEGVTPELVDSVVSASSKTNMAKLPDPIKKRPIIRLNPRPFDEWYTDADRAFVADLCRRNLKYTFGYRYW